MLFEHMRDPLVLTDLGGQLIQAKPMAMRRLGSQPKAVGQPLHEAIKDLSLREALTLAERPRPARGFLLQAAAHQLTQLKNARVRDGVKHLQAFLAPRHQAALRQGLQMTRNVGLCPADDSRQVIHRPLPLKQGVQ